MYNIYILKCLADNVSHNHVVVVVWVHPKSNSSYTGRAEFAKTICKTSYIFFKEETYVVYYKDLNVLSHTCSHLLSHLKHLFHNTYPKHRVGLLTSLILTTCCLPLNG